MMEVGVRDVHVQKGGWHCMATMSVGHVTCYVCDIGLRKADASLLMQCCQWVDTALECDWMLHIDGTMLMICWCICCRLASHSPLDPTLQFPPSFCHLF